MKQLFVLLGPTAVGKTELSLELAEYLHCPIISADSRQLFRELPVGTAAPTADERQRVQHFFVADHSVDDYYSASLYERDVLQLLDAQFREREVALMSGGSMMYIDAVCNGIDDIPTVRDDIRQTMKRRLAEEGLEALVEQLHQLDPEHWAIVDRKNPRRVLHALEICIQTGKTYTSFRTNSRRERPFQIIKIGLNRDREELYNRINRRVLQMMEQGLEQEARAVYPKRANTALLTVGYKELFQYFDGAISRDEAIRQIQSHTREYMRKQLTWFRRDADIHWFHPNKRSEILQFVSDTLKK